LSPDPIKVAGGLNLYGYVLGDPVNAVDPLGLYIGAPGSEVWHPLAHEGTDEQRKKGGVGAQWQLWVYLLLEQFQHYLPPQWRSGKAERCYHLCQDFTSFLKLAVSGCMALD